MTSSIQIDGLPPIPNSYLVALLLLGMLAICYIDVNLCTSTSGMVATILLGIASFITGSSLKESVSATTTSAQAEQITQLEAELKSAQTALANLTNQKPPQ